MHCCEGYGKEEAMKGSKKQDKSFMRKVICCICVIKSQNSIPKRIESRDSDLCTLMFTAAVVIITKRWIQPKCSADEWINKIQYIHIVEYYSALKRNGILMLKTEISLKHVMVMVSKISQLQKDKCGMVPLI